MEALSPFTLKALADVTIPTIMQMRSGIDKNFLRLFLTGAASFLFEFGLSDPGTTNHEAVAIYAVGSTGNQRHLIFPSLNT